MKLTDFRIGLEFFAGGGFRWQCTDVGTRTIVAIRMDHDDPNWYRGPPYISKEVVFDEPAIRRCNLSEKDVASSAADSILVARHPGYPGDVVEHMVRRRYESRLSQYPHVLVLRLDRCRADGELLHPFAAHRDGDIWTIELYLPFLKVYEEMAEADFIALPLASRADVCTRASRVHSDGG